MRGVLIGLTGRAGSGKSAAAEYLERVHGFKRTRFAGPLKDMLRVIGLSEREIEGDLKEQPCELLCGKTPRLAMQELGTAWGRNIIGEHFWARAWMSGVMPILEAGQSVCVEDCRFPNEADAVKALYGHIIRIRTDEPAPIEHISEAHDLPYDVSVFNEKCSLEVLHARIEGALLQLGGSDE